MAEKIKTVRDLIVYQKAFDCAMDIFRITAAFPQEEKYSLTDQIRRSSRSVCSSLLVKIFCVMPLKKGIQAWIPSGSLP